MLLFFEDERAPATRLAQASGLTPHQIERHRFPDGELKLRLPAALPRQVVVLRSLNDPNEKLVELLLLATTARTLGAQHLTLVAPYLAYMRQDLAFHAGEVISQRVVGSFIAGLFDALITVDPHLHRVSTLAQAVPVAQPLVLSGAPLLGDWIALHRANALLIGPDEESAQWVAQAAQRHGFDYAVCHKTRHNDHAVQVQLPQVDVAGRQVVVMDDVISTGHTVAQATKMLLAAGARSVDVAVTHALFATGALALLKQAGVGEIWSTDCIAHASNQALMAVPLAQALARVRESAQASG
jgi:ribose-phosphate pyrophosphokinase